MISTAKVLSSHGGLLFLGLVTLLPIGDVASAADQKKGSQGAQESQGTKGTQGIQDTRGTQEQGLPCDVSEGRNVSQAGKDADRASHIIFGEVTRVDGMTYVVKDEKGKEVKLQTDERTEKSPIQKGDHISASVDKQNHALWIRANRGTDRRTEHVAGGCDPS
ncbi:MAG TPA: hypothetical protein VLE46_05525 [Nitrospira sp.]|nr:hypothetical protein [Nitrospira sp.]